ncbi:ABC transporter permease [Candidatus Acetothermia bacterium]|nr:MAG: ABC transporter permease [Candidatus Acetothermia bacterium]RLE32705.1 MAG: ABC transporter permease [Candidatus Acetothermia bacterium]
MFAYIIRRILQMFIVLFGLSVLVFIMLKLTPGDPAVIMAGLGATPETVQSIREKLGLDRPWHEQYWRLVSGLFNGELQAMTYHVPVWQIIFERLPATVELGLFALLIALIVSIPAGLLSAIFRNTLVDYGVTTIALMGISMPVFWTALILMIIFGVTFRVLPISGRGATIGAWSFLTLDGLRHLVIPSLALSSVLMAMNARLTRASMLEVLRQEYIKTARAKGLKESVVLLKHAFRNAMAPVLTNIGLQINTLFAGAVLTETTTAWPGMGRLMVEAINRRDMAVVLGLALFLAAVAQVLYLLVDLMYVWIDPRISYD